MRARIAACAVASLLAIEGAALADDTSLDVRLFHGYATLLSRRVAHVRANEAWSFVVHDLPDGAAATGFRARFGAASAFEEASLLPADLAPARAADAHGPYALLAWNAPGELALELSSAAGDDVVETSIVAPTQWIDGRDVITLPASFGTFATVRAAIADDASFVDGVVVSSTVSFPLDHDVVVSLARADTRPIQGSLARIRVEASTELTALRVEVPAPLSTIPKGVHVVVVLDASRSEGESFDAEKTAASAYLASFRDVEGAAVEVLSFARRVDARTTGFVSVEAAIAALEVPIPLANGSALDAALSRAKHDLDALPDATPKRIVALSDLELRDAIDVDGLARVIESSGAIVHLGTVYVSEPASLTPTESDQPWTLAARVTGGLVWSAGAPQLAAPASTKELDHTFAEWARPSRLQHVRVAGADIPVDDELVEGASFSDVHFIEQAPAKVTVHGELWSKPVKATFEVDEAGNMRAAAFAIASDLRSSFTDDQIARIATYAGVVSPMTSFLARPRGTHLPLLGELAEEPLLSYGGFGMSGTGFGCSHCGGIGYSSSSKPLRAPLAAALQSCGGAHAEFALETATGEILDVKVKAGSPALEACLTEAVWSIELPSRIYGHHHWVMSF